MQGLAMLVVAAALAQSAGAAEPAKPFRIGVVVDAWSGNHPTVEGLKAGLSELGLVEGRDVIFDVHLTRGDPNAAAAAAESLAKARVDLIFATNEGPAFAAKKATKSIPVVFALVGDPVAVGMVDSLPYPGGNLTGVSSRAAELAPKRLEILKDLVPALRRVWFVYHAADITDTAAISSLGDAARRLGLELLPRAVTDSNTLAQALKDVRLGDALLSPSSNTLDIPAAILEAALASRLPAVFPAALWVSHGALVSYGPDFRAEGVQAARMVAKILRGARAKDVPIEGVENIHLALNLKTVSQLGLSVPRKIIFRANVVYR